MTSLLQRAVEILQMSTPELRELAHNALRENPLLEESPETDALDVPEATASVVLASPEPEPGRPFGGSDPGAVVPDIVVLRVGADYVVTPNEDGVPRLRLNPRSRAVLRGSDAETRRYVDEKLRSAVWLIKSIDQRQQTLARITTSIVKFQREFFDHGGDSLHPLSPRDVARDLGVHESTIRRVIPDKYVQTPHGLFPLEFFFRPQRPRPR